MSLNIATLGLKYYIFDTGIMYLFVVRIIIMFPVFLCESPSIVLNINIIIIILYIS